MIDECLEADTEFGILWMGEAGLHDVGCSAEITQLLDRMDDGRMNILVQGTNPFRLSRRIDDMPYPAGDIELLDEDVEGSEIADPGAAARQEYADLVERVTDSRPSDKDLSELDSYGMAATIALELDAKQELLELRSEQARLDRLRVFSQRLGSVTSCLKGRPAWPGQTGTCAADGVPPARMRHP